MGITFQSARFTGGPPTLEEIVSEATRMCGLSLEIHRPSADPFYRYSAELGFEVASSERVTVYAHDPDELRRFCLQQREMLRKPDIVALAKARPEIARVVEHLSLAAGDQDGASCVSLRGVVGEEGTIRAVVALALESLGGNLRPVISEAQRAAGAGPITAAILQRRRRAHNLAWAAGMLSAPWHLIKKAWGSGRR
jgi:hypothetical protein